MTKYEIQLSDGDDTNSDSYFNFREWERQQLEETFQDRCPYDNEEAPYHEQ